MLDHIVISTQLAPGRRLFSAAGCLHGDGCWCEQVYDLPCSLSAIFVCCQRLPLLGNTLVAAATAPAPHLAGPPPEPAAAAEWQRHKARADASFQGGEFPAAVEGYTEALKAYLALDAGQHTGHAELSKLLANRCMSLQRAQRWDDAVSDAVRATRVSPQWEKGELRAFALAQAVQPPMWGVPVGERWSAQLYPPAAHT